MFKVALLEPNRLNIEIDGKIEANEMKDGLNELLKLSEKIENGKMLYRITHFSLPSLSAIGVEMTFVPKLFTLIHRFDFAALVTDEEWIQKGGEIKGALIPGLEIKAFDLNETEETEAWLNSCN